MSSEYLGVQTFLETPIADPQIRKGEGIQVTPPTRVKSDLN